MTHNNPRARNAEVEDEIRPSSDDRDQEQDTVDDTRFLINPEHSRIEPSKRCRNATQHNPGMKFGKRDTLCNSVFILCYCQGLGGGHSLHLFGTLPRLLLSIQK
ncbi:hypothetical protein BDL97_14G098000 [Sphagnum fallax]|uniref:Uncharacterized protein n=1 Tax=Sphagnum jensenii TaxID=128206 RepID=A0ABP0W688_9BRYO|nr:hypothetical protein BDL97_14G098000 [Sphagnum fallax]